MRAGKELDLMIAREVMGHSISREKRGTWIEGTPRGTRPLAPYSTEIESAWEVAHKAAISLIPVEDPGAEPGAGRSWFALAGTNGGWRSPADFLQYLQTADFATAGAAVGPDAPLTICIAAVKQAEKRKLESANAANPEPMTQLEQPAADGIETAKAPEAAAISRIH